MDIKIAVIAGMKKNSQAICEQLNSVLGSIFEFIPFTDKDLENVSLNYDLMLISTYSLFSRQKSVNISDQNNVIVINRTLLKSGYEKIKELPLDDKILVVNDDRDSTIESIALLYELGLRNANLIPVYPGVSDIPPIEYAITLGEMEYVPDHVKTTIDVGKRVVDINTMVEILIHFDLLNSETEKILDDYSEIVMTRNHGLQGILQELIDTGNFLQETLSLVEDGVVTYDQNNIINIFNSKAEEIFNIKSSNIIGKEISEFCNKVSINEKLLIEEKSDRLINVNNQSLIINSKNIGYKTRSYGGVLTFKVAKQVEDLENKLRSQLKSKGHIAKYTFDNIITKNKRMKEVISNAKKMAKSDLSILIIGESGTGKELFAHAIHDESPRSQFPFIAINCSSLPESLLESELFGYEEGAFTGARRGGKPGLFEQAHKGTIFLDEIGDISPTLQARLLRVIQEKEVLKIGGTKIIPVDVKIIAATNKNLLQQVKENKFREDLYYRLNVLQINIPPLRDRKDDIPLLINSILKERGSKQHLSEDLLNVLTEHEWLGNIRELENTIEYYSLMNNWETLPENPLFLKEGNNQKDSFTEEQQDHSLTPIESLDIDNNFLILRLLLKANNTGISAGRRSLVKMARREGIVISESNVRKAIDYLKASDMIDVKIGRAGSKVTSKGINAIHQHNLN
ncbi:sigma-54 interaction domain-containing protein [Oceanobacillus sp. CAU 1775]